MIEFTVTVFPVPTFLLLNVDPTVLPKVSEPTNPVKVSVVEAVVPPSYVLFDVDAVAVNAFGTMFPVVDD